MKQLFNLVAALLCLSGVLHLIKVFAYPLDPNSTLAIVITLLFGLAYLVIGGMMFRNPEPMVLWGAVVPAIGLILTLIGMRPNPDWFIISFIVLDVLVIAACIYIYFKGRNPLRS
jgi:hypothetical protein